MARSKISTDLIQRVSDVVDQKLNGKISLILCHHSTRRLVIQLTDADRRDWLLALAQRMRHAREQNQALALSCSALKRSYRDVLRTAVPDLQLVHLVADFELIAQRMSQRPGHYMPASLLESQFAALEAPGTDENAWAMPATQSASAIVQSLGQRLQSLPARTPHE